MILLLHGWSETAIALLLLTLRFIHRLLCTPCRLSLQLPDLDRLCFLLPAGARKLH